MKNKKGIKGKKREEKREEMKKKKKQRKRCNMAHDIPYQRG